MADNSPRRREADRSRDIISNSSRVVALREQAQRLFGGTVQRQEGPEDDQLQIEVEAAPVQRQGLEKKQPLQGVLAPAQKKEDRTGLPDTLKSGVEDLSGMSMDDVKVHYNSSEPAQLQALAYTQGTQIYLGPGQERHLPHEAWHVAQQLQGRVRPTGQLKGVGINDDDALEREADVMGAKSSRAVSASPRISPSIVDNGPAVQRAVIQRAVGMEFECTALEITAAPEGAKKGDIIAQDSSRHWDMTYEETAAGPAVVEFVVEPAAEEESELINAVTDMTAEAKGLDKTTPTVVGSYTIERKGDIAGAIQVTMGTPLADLPKLFDLYRGAHRIGESRAYERYKKLLGKDVTTQVQVKTTHRFLGFKKLSWTTTSTKDVTTRVHEKAPDGTEVRNLPDSTKGFILLLMDYIVQGYVPDEWIGKAKIPFAKGLYALMARTDFTSMFKTLPPSEINRLSEMNKTTNEREMKEEWWKWIIEKSLDNDNLTQDFLDEDQLINVELTNLTQQGGDPVRSKFLKRLPEEDLLTAQGYLGLGKLGNKADVSATDPKKLAPIFELRKPYSSSAPYTTWIDKAKETWDNYVKIVGEKMKRGGRIN